jgi:biopolymer transport protein ExbB
MNRSAPPCGGRNTAHEKAANARNGSRTARRPPRADFALSGICRGGVVDGGRRRGAVFPRAAAQEELSDELTDIDSVSAGTPSAVPPAKRTMLDELLASGIIGLIIILLSMVSLGFIIEHFITIRKSALMPEPVVQELEELIHQGDLQGAIEACRDPNNQCLFTDVALAGLERYHASEFGFAEYRSAVEEAGEDQTGRLYRKTEVLNVIGSIAPMLGLLGTVRGMIIAFNTIATTEGAAKPYQLASAISLALVTTFLGLIVAIPTMAAFSFFRSRIDSIVAEAGKRIEQVMMPLGRKR